MATQLVRDRAGLKLTTAWILHATNYLVSELIVIKGSIRNRLTDGRREMVKKCRGKRSPLWLLEGRLIGAEPWRISIIFKKREREVGKDCLERRELRQTWARGHWRGATWYECQLHLLPSVWPLEPIQDLAYSSVNAGNDNKSSNGSWDSMKWCMKSIQFNAF